MILIKNGTVHVGNGQVLNNTDILIKDSIIAQVGEDIEVTSDMEVIDASNNIVMPGFIDTLNSWGAKGPSWSDNDLEETSDPISPHLNSVYAFDHDATNFQEVYRYGVTSFGFAPGIRNVVGGKIASFKTYGKSPYKMLVEEECGMMASITASAKNKDGAKKNMTKMGILALLRQALYNAKAYKESNKYDAKNLELKRVIDRKLPMFINCTTKGDIESVNSIVDEFNLDVVLVGAYNITDNITEVKKIVLGNLTDSMLMNNYNVDFKSINNLINEGALMSISSCGDSNAGGKESLLWNGILYYNNGIPSEEVLKMMTLNPAKILGIDNKVGSIEIGKDADIAIWSGNPIETFKANIVHCFICGEDVSKIGGRTSCW